MPEHRSNVFGGYDGEVFLSCDAPECDLYVQLHDETVDEVMTLWDAHVNGRLTDERNKARW